MVGKKEKIGFCHLCGSYGERSREHVPPKAAFNDQPVWVAKNEALFGAEDYDSFIAPRSKKDQRGAWNYTLCAKCNNDTGAWYAPSFTDWAMQGMDYLLKAQGAPAVAVPFHLFPMRIFKQVITMFFSACQEGLYEREPNLVRFVLNREDRQFPPHLRVFAYYNDPAISTASRQAGWTGLYELGYRGARIFSEISFPPFGFILSVNTPEVDRRLIDITYFKEYAFRDYDVMYLKLPALPVCSPFPADFRSQEELKANFEARKQHGDTRAQQPG